VGPALQVVLPKLQKSGQDAVKARLRELRARFRAKQAKAKMSGEGGAASPGATLSGEVSDDDESDDEESGSEVSLASTTISGSEAVAPRSMAAAKPGQIQSHLHRRHVSAAGTAAADAAQPVSRTKSTAGVVDAAAADRRQRARVNAFIAHAADQGTMLSYTTTAVCAVLEARFIAGTPLTPKRIRSSIPNHTGLHGDGGAVWLRRAVLGGVAVRTARRAHQQPH